MSQLRKWPADAIMVIAAHAGEENRENMEGLYECECRDCGARLHADTFTVRTAENLPSRMGRPVKFFCIPCHYKYDPRTITEMHDHSNFLGEGFIP